MSSSPSHTQTQRSLLRAPLLAMLLAMSLALSLALSLGALVAPPALAAPVFSASYNVAALGVALGWSSDLGPGVTDLTRSFPGAAAPITKAAAATRDRRTIAAAITQSGPYVLADEYWAADWTGSIDVPGPGLYGLFGSAFSDGTWNFMLPGQTWPEALNTVFHYAMQWDVSGPADIHPIFSWNGGAARALTGSETGSFTLSQWYRVGIPGFRTRPDFQASTFSLDVNQPGRMDFSARIAFSTTPIDTRVFDSPPVGVAEPMTAALLLAGLVATAVPGRWRRRTISRA